MDAATPYFVGTPWLTLARQCKPVIWRPNHFRWLSSLHITKAHRHKSMRFCGGERWIRTTEGKPDRFTVCCHWPLGNLPEYLVKKMELAIGIEPTTCWLQVSCSANWAMPAKCGASGRNRTTDTGIFSPLLYRLSYRGIKKWRPGTGSNRRPPAWQAGILTNWTTGPSPFIY